MFFKTEEEKIKFHEEKEKQLKVYEKLEKKLFSNPSLILEEIDKKPTKDLRVVLLSNKDDLCKKYFETLPMNDEGEKIFIKIFDFVFKESELVHIKSERLLIDDFKAYLTVAVNKKYVLGVDSVINFFEKKIDIMNNLKLILTNSIQDNNYTLLKFMFLKPGERNKKSQFEITDNLFFASPKDLSLLMKGMYRYQTTYDTDPKMVGAYKACAFEKDEYINKLISKLKVFFIEISETKTNSANVMIKKVEAINEIFYYMQESTISNLIYSFQEKKSAVLLFKYASVINTLSKNNMLFPSQVREIKNIMFAMQKTFLDFAKDDKKIELINKNFENISNYYSSLQLEEVEKHSRKQILLNQISEIQEVKNEKIKAKKKI